MPHEAALKDTPLWDRGLSGSAFVQAFQNECHIVRKGLDGDLLKVTYHIKINSITDTAHSVVSLTRSAKRFTLMHTS